MAKHNRENAVRERRLRKQARKDARKLAAAAPPSAPSDGAVDDDHAPGSELIQAPADA